MSNEMSEQEVAIISALAGSVVETIDESISDAVEIIEDKVQFLIDADLVEDGVHNTIIRMALHLVVDSILDDLDEADADCEECESEDEDEDEVESNPVY